MTTELSYPRIRRAIAETPWAIVPEKLADIMAMVAIRAAGGTLTDEEIAQRIGAAMARPRPTSRAPDIAVLLLVGTISHRMGMMSRSSGGTSVEEFQQAVAHLGLQKICAIEAGGGACKRALDLARVDTGREQGDSVVWVWHGSGVPGLSWHAPPGACPAARADRDPDRPWDWVWSAGNPRRKSSWHRDSRRRRRTFAARLRHCRRVSPMACRQRALRLPATRRQAWQASA